MVDAHEAAAFWGTAQNQHYTEAERLACALTSLEFFGGVYEFIEETIEGHSFSYTQQDTGITLCRHPDHQLAGWSATCWKAQLKRELERREENTT